MANPFTNAIREDEEASARRNAPRRVRCHCGALYRVLNDIPRCGHTGSRQARCQKMATCRLRRTDRRQRDMPWFEYCDACATAIQSENPMTERGEL